MLNLIKVIYWQGKSDTLGKKKTMAHTNFLYNIVILRLANNGALLLPDAHVTAIDASRSSM